MPDEPIQLFCVVGGSPAEVTETVYALAVVDEEDDPAEHIERIRVMTTTHGRAKLEPVLLNQLRQMARDYPQAADSPAQEADLCVVPARRCYGIACVGSP